MLQVLSDSETVRWLNHAVEKIWPVCMEQIVSQKILLPIVPWFLQKYKPWTVVWSPLLLELFSSPVFWSSLMCLYVFLDGCTIIVYLVFAWHVFMHWLRDFRPLLLIIIDITRVCVCLCEDHIICTIMCVFEYVYVKTILFAKTVS